MYLKNLHRPNSYLSLSVNQAFWESDEMVFVSEAMKRIQVYFDRAYRGQESPCYKQKKEERNPSDQGVSSSLKGSYLRISFMFSSVLT